MSVSLSQYVQCETIQERLEDDFLACMTPLDKMPALEAILATQVAGGIAQSVSDVSGKVKNVKVTYKPRLLETSVTDMSGTRACASTNESFNDYAIYTIDPTIWMQADEKFNVAELATVCTDDVNSMITKKLNSLIDVAERKVATKTANELVTLYGSWGANAASAYTVTNDELVLARYVSAATKVIDYRSAVILDSALDLTGFCAPAIIVGGTALSDYMKFVNHGCCSATGADVLSIANDYGKVVMHDKRVRAALGSELKSIAFQAGSLALIHYNEAPQVPNIGANYVKFRVNAPRTGLPMDVTISDNCGVISILVMVNTKLVGLPTDMFLAGDEYRGVKFVNKILVTDPA